ncbi:MAG: tetratricopeptide repeat protein [Flavobacteriales bacterium]|nr:tetratricopeptide repeat protein [Flavobacteriales bacterium]MCW8912566.1 tetratricopeptide repeat protein [Flavobacteriales bacterium]MCW8937524.1 tetratricopeptide repeat protein [Flavobacteriales bacterium]MCW8939364.1 tetratricopeptide repeat protein [Flavobacteriales bacterium]MCW8968564.1 tetratricopeptide repeat protein [Flavobacteriales bacterium]
MKRLIYLFLLLLPTYCLSSVNLDSLYQEVLNSKNDIEKINSSVEYIRFCYTKDEKNFKLVYERLNKLLKNEKSSDYKHETTLKLARYLSRIGAFKEAKQLLKLSLSQQNNEFNNNWKSIYFFRLSKIYFEEGERKMVINYIDSSLKYLNKEDSLLRISYIMEKGRAFYDLGDYAKAMELYVIAQKQFESYNIRDINYGMLMHFIGSVFKRQNNDARAFDYYEEMLEVAIEIHDKHLEAEAYSLLADLYAYAGDYEKEEEYLYKALNIVIDLNDELAEAHILLAIVHGNIYDHKYKEALIKLDRIQDIVKKYNITEYDITINRYLGKIYSRMGKYEKAMKFFELAILAANKREEKKMLNLSDIYRNIAVSSYKNKSFKNAYEYLDLHLIYKDSLLNEENQQIIHKLEQQYENQKKESEIIALNKDKQIQEKELSKQNVMIKAFLVGLLLTLLLASTIFYSLTQNKKKNKIISSKVIELAEKNKEITDSIQYAKRIQNAILPPNKVVKEYLQESFILYKPKDIVAGDFYWMEQKNEEVLFAAADCTGHGVPGAMVSVVCNNGLNRSVREYGLTDPGEILNKTREIVISEFEKSEEDVKDGMDIALCCLKYKIENENLENSKTVALLHYAGANNPLWIIRKNSKTLEEIKANKQPIGKFDNPEPYTTHKIILEKGDTIYVFSDGYVDQFGGEKGKKYKASNFKSLLISIQAKDMNEQKEIINKTFETWKGNLEQLDDVCVIGVRI